MRYNLGMFIEWEALEMEKQYWLSLIWERS